MVDTLFDRLRKSDRLPSPPGTALRVLELCSSEEVAAPEIAKVISSDPALSSRILKFANSPVSGIGRSIASIQQAITLLGLRTVKTLSLGFSLVTQHVEQQCAGFDYYGYWRQCLACATFSKRLAALNSKVSREDAFAAGLLAGLGRMVLAVGVPDEYGIILNRIGGNLENLPEEEEAEFRTTHMEIGARMLEEWRLPDAICQAVRGYRNLNSDPTQIDPMHVCLHVADGLARRLWGQEEASKQGLKDAAELAQQHFDLHDQAFQEFVDQTAAELTELAKILSLPVGNAPTFAELQVRAQDQMLQISLATQLENQVVRQENETLQHRVRVDALTRIGNRDAFDERLETEIERSLRNGTALSLIMLDIDHFKKFNDAHGHQAGDEVLRNMGDNLRDCVRKVDFPARYGGEEFAVIAPDAAVRGADLLAERIRQVIETKQVLFEDRYLRVTASVGVAVWSGTQVKISAQDMIKAADECLYAAKRNGRNQVKLMQIGTKEAQRAVAVHAGNEVEQIGGQMR